MKASVFLSCGQNKKFGEVAIAENIAQKIRDIGFECYMAVREQSLESVRENIFTRLESCDYFVFIDFKREELKISPPVCRGSLFSHQELAIASFLKIPALLLCEVGVDPRDGMVGALQANVIPFSDRNSLPKVVAEHIQNKLSNGIWRIDTKNSLSLEVAGCPFTSVWIQNLQKWRHFYHIAVRNNHHRKAALHCHAYLDEIINLDTNTAIIPKAVEFKWAGTPFPDVRIRPKTVREFDGFNFIETVPKILERSQAVFFLNMGQLLKR